ncbi:MAG: leucyl aminopeptidase [Alphaproteobacteria bacterium]
MKISFQEPAAVKAGAVVVGVHEDKKMTAAAQALDKATGGAVERAIKASRFAGKGGQSLEILAPAGLPNSRILLVGLGKTFGEREQLALGGNVAAKLEGAGEKEATVVLDAAGEDMAEAAARVALGARLRLYRFDKYRTKKEAASAPTLKKFTVQVAGAAGARKAFQPMEQIADGVFFTRDLVSEPPNVLFPKSFARECRKLEEVGVTVEVLGEKEMEKLGMRALLGVGQGSERESQFVVLQWNGAGKEAQPVAFVGKGVTFDTGGISLKPGPGMDAMKWDMGGAGAVTGLMRALAGRKAKVNAVGILGLVENMPDGRAQRPGDIVTSMSGQTIEILNTDAEGRLVLCDALHYVQERFKPKFIVDLATLTGAIVISLGHEHAGLFSNNDDLAEHLIAAGLATGEKLWRMPLGDAYDKLLDSPVADMKNIGGRDAGSISAAQFLQRFIQDKTAWAHLDIAGTAWTDKENAVTPKGGTGFGVRLLDRLVADYYEE